MDQHLHVFVTVAEKHNFSRAAEELHMTQPAVSQYIRLLEENHDVRLLERNNQYVRLNKAGEIVYDHAKEIIGLYTRMQNLLDDLTQKANGPLSIGASYTFGEYVLPHVIANMKARYPEIQPTVTIGNTAEIADAVTHHQLDIGIVEGHFKQEKQLKTEVFAEDGMVIVASASHPLTQQSGEVSTTDLAAETWILRELGSGTREAADNVLETFDIKPDNIIHFGSTQAIKEAIESGLGVSLLSKWAIQKELRHGDLRIIDARGLPVARQFSLVTATPYQTKALQVFTGLLREKEWLDSSPER